MDSDRDWWIFFVVVHLSCAIEEVKVPHASWEVNVQRGVTEGCTRQASKKRRHLFALDVTYENYEVSRSPYVCIHYWAPPLCSFEMVF
jgi:hypothetical protein